MNAITMESALRDNKELKQLIIDKELYIVHLEKKLGLQQRVLATAASAEKTAEALDSSQERDSDDSYSSYTPSPTTVGENIKKRRQSAPSRATATDKATADTKVNRTQSNTADEPGRTECVGS